MGSNYRGSEETTYHPQYVSVSDENFGYLLLQYIWLLWEKIYWERINQEFNDNTMPLAGDEDDQCLIYKNTRNITRRNYTFYSIYVHYNTRK